MKNRCLLSFQHLWIGSCFISLLCYLVQHYWFSTQIRDISFLTRRRGRQISGCEGRKKNDPPSWALVKESDLPSSRRADKNINDAVALGTWLEYSLKWAYSVWHFTVIWLRQENNVCSQQNWVSKHSTLSTQVSKLIYLSISHNKPESY